jgi:hypothetical protein
MIGAVDEWSSDADDADAGTGEADGLDGGTSDGDSGLEVQTLSEFRRRVDAKLAVPHTVDPEVCRPAGWRTDAATSGRNSQ